MKLHLHERAVEGVLRGEYTFGALEAKHFLTQKKTEQINQIKKSVAQECLYEPVDSYFLTLCYFLKKLRM